MQEILLTYLIDDDLDDQEVFSMAIEEIQPFSLCLFANDGMSAIEKFRSDRTFLPNLIFIDINMPKMDGIQCLKEIRKMTHLDRIPAYMYSTSDEQLIVDECMKIGAAGFLKKEVSIQELQKKLSKIFSIIKNPYEKI